MPLAAGTRLGVYEILGVLGAGGMGEVYRARDTKLQRDVAIKILPPDGTTSVIQERFLREARAASALIHPNIITVHEINSAGGTDFIVMEYVRGEALSAILAGGRLPVGRSLQYAIQICDALRAAHEAGVVHRDLKPANIMIAASGLVKVVDFGIAKRLGGADADLDMTSAAALTAKGISIGTPAYMSPEQTLSDPVDARSDLFSFGVVLYQMLAGVLPFQATTTLTLVRQIVHEAQPPLRGVAPAVPAAVAAIVDKCLEKRPDDRYPTAAAVGDALRRVATLPEPASVVDDATRTAMRAAADHRPPRGVSRRAIGVACLLGIAVAAWAGGPPVMRWVRDRAATGTPAVDPDAGASARELYQRATEGLRVYYRPGNVDKAIAQLQRALQQQPVYPLAEARLSLAYWRKNALSSDEQWQKVARAHADRAVAGDAQLAVAHMAQGLAFSLRGDYDNASAAYQRAATLDPANWELLWRMGDLAVARREPDAAAEALYRRSTEAAPTQWEPFTRLGGFYYRRGRYEDAVGAYQKARELAPDHPRMSSNLAAVFHHLGRTDEAAAVLQQSLEIAPDPITYSNLGTLLYFQGKYPESLSAFERAVQHGANTYLYWGNLGDAARMAPGGATKAHEAYTRAVQLARDELSRTPADVDARSSAAVYLMRDGQAKAALAEIDQVLAQKPVPPAVLFKAALVTELAGQRARALDLLDRALAAGYQLREIRQEPDLVTLRTDPQYHTLASRYEK